MEPAFMLVPPLPVLEYWRPKPKGAGERSRHRVFPKALEDELTQIARDAVRAGVDPVLAAGTCITEAQVRALLEKSFRKFIKERNRVWPPVIHFVKDNWLVLFPLLREVSGLIHMERTRIPVPDVEDEGPGARSLMRFGLALRTYELTIELALGSMPKVIVGLATGKAPKELANPKSLVELLDRIDTATAALEFGTIAAIRLLDRQGAVESPVFDLVTEYAARGADEQHAIIRGVLRSVIGEKPVPQGVSEARDAAAVEVPPEAILADWVRAVLAA
jgi:hypothetical protein